MSEEHIAQPAVPPDTPVHTYEDVLAKHPNMHPGLKEQVQRLAIEAQVEQPTEPKVPEEGTMAFLLHKTNKQIEDFTHTTDTHTYSGLPYDANEILRKGEYSLEELGELLNKQVALQAEDQRRIAAQTNTLEGKLNVREFLVSLQAIPTETLRALHTASPELSHGLHEIMKNAHDDHDKFFVLQRLTEIYGVSDVLDLYQADSAASKDVVLTHYREQPLGDVVPLIAFRRREERWGASEAERSNAKRDWADRYLDRVVGMPKDMRDDLMFASYSRVSDRETGFVAKEKLPIMLENAALNIKSLGLEKATLLREQAGIVNFDYFTADQLQLTADLLRGDPNATKHLQEHDVVVSMNDARGDYNGALANNSLVYRTAAFRTVVFEIGKSGDFYRHLLLLEKHGIKPSTLAVGAHGNVGVIGFGKDEGEFTLQQQHMGKASGLRQVVRRFMQDNRGIDDPSAKGTRRVILDSCHQARTHKTQRPRLPHEKRQKPIHHLTRRGKRDVVDVEESMADTLLKVANDPRLRVYGSPEGIVSVRRGDSARFQKGRKSESEPPTLLPIQEMHIDEDGIIHTSEIEEISIDPARERAAA